MRSRLVALFLSVCVAIAGLGVGGAAAQDAAAVARAHLAANAGIAGLTAAEVEEMVVSDIVPGPPGVEIVYLQQRHAGLDVHNALATVAVKGQQVIHVADSLVAGVPLAARGQAAVLSDVDAAEAAAQALGLQATEAFAPDGEPDGLAERRVLSDGGISRDPIPVEQVWQRDTKDGVRLAWRLVIREVTSESWWDIRIDARTGEELDRANWVAHVGHDDDARSELVDNSSYRVFGYPVESPNHASTPGVRTLEAEPAWAGASPFGWHDTNGAVGPEFTTTQGNNVHAYTDIDADNLPDAASSPDGGAGLDFDFPLDLTQAPSTYRPAAVTNLFFWNNLIHDTFYRYGFDEASGNFQTNNYGNGGAGNDAVLAEAQDGAGTNNANFGTPPDGSPGRMQMFIWTAPNPDRDGDLDNGIIIHEYGHGISNRLTGGPANASCLNNAEQGGEGWSDWLALMMTIEPGDTGPDGRGIGTYALNEATTGPGIRPFRYSTDLTIDPRTYGDITTAAVPHGVGSIWSAMLWEVTWAMIDQHGFDPDLITGDAGNNMAIQLVMDGMKLQPCTPGFVDARDAIIAADVATNGGDNVCLLWDAFAKRGLGASASQGSSGSVMDGVEAFDMPTECLDLQLYKTASPDGTVGDDNVLTYSLQAINASDGPLADVVITDPIPAGTTFVPGSATCGGTVAGGIITFDLGTLPLGASTTCTFDVRTDDGVFTETVFADAFDAADPLANWTASAGPPNWTVVDTDAPRSAPNHVFAPDTAAVALQELTLTTPVPVIANSVLRFWHRYDTEPGFDGGVVEISDDGGTTWDDAGPAMTVNPYNDTLSTGFSNPLPGRDAFSGFSGGYLQTTVDLAAYVGQDILVRFMLGSDSSVSDVGWWIDDVTIGTDVRVINTATASATAALDVDSMVETVVVEGTNQPDLVVTAVDDPPSSADPGDSFGVTDTTENLGDAAAAASQTRYHLSTDATLSAGDVLLTGARAVPGLAVGAVSASGRSVTIPGSTDDGSYRLIACADDTDLLTESDEGNNCRTSTGSITVTAPDPLEADLVVSDLDDVPAAAAVGSSFEVSSTTANAGDGDAGASRTRFYLSADATIDGDDERLTGSRSIPALDPGEDAGGDTTLTIPDDVAVGSYRLIACADDLDDVEESDEGNNCRASSAADSVQVTPAFVADDGSLTIIDPSADTAGNSRVAIEFAQHTIPDAATFAQAGSGEVLLASEAVFADALASGALQSDRPLLLNDPQVLEPEVLAEIQRLGATRVRILGGDLAISPAVADALTAAGLEVVRTFGPTRLETAQAIADLVPADGAFLARAFPLPTATDQTQAFADTLALGGWAAASGQPIYLTQTEVLSGSTITALTARAAQQLHVIGGTAAISDPTQIAAAALTGAIDRIAGPNRFATATAIAAGRGVSATAPVDTLIVIEGQAAGSWVAGFSAALLSAQTDAPVVLVNGELIPDETRVVIDTMVNDDPDVICSASTTVCTAVGDLLGVTE